jgi:hypothetical protein
VVKLRVIPTSSSEWDGVKEEIEGRPLTVNDRGMLLTASPFAPFTVTTTENVPDADGTQGNGLRLALVHPVGRPVHEKDVGAVPWKPATKLTL